MFCDYIIIGMKTRIFLFAICFSIKVFAQHMPLPHGTIFGSKPSTTEIIEASHLDVFMNKKTRISTTIRGTVIKVVKIKGGWFNIDAGHGKIIAAHFKNIGINIPKALKGKTVIVEGVAAKQFLADDMQHFAGDTVSGKKQHTTQTNPKRRLDFEVSGLMVDK